MATGQNSAFAGKQSGALLLWLMLALCTLGCLPAPIFAATLSAAPLAAATLNPSRSAGPDWSQLADTVFQHLDTEHGMPNASVTALAQDGEGFIWVGTQDGLARWDGYRFHNYQPRPNDVHSLPGNLVFALHTDKKGRLWVGTASSGLARYDSSIDGFIRIGGISQASVFAIEDDGFDGVWVGTWGGGLNHVDSAGRIQTVRREVKAPASQSGNPPGASGHPSSGLPSDVVRVLLRDRSGRLWVGTSEGLAYQDGQRFVRVAFPATAGAAKSVERMHQSKDGRIWVGCDAGLFFIEPGQLQMQALPAAFAAQSGLAQEKIGALQETSDGELWVGTNAHGVALFDTRAMRVRWLQHVASMPSSLAANTVFAMLRDRSGLIWVGGQLGLNYHDPNQRAIHTLFGNSGRANSLRDIAVSSVFFNPDGSLWLGSPTRGVDIINGANHQLSSLVADASQPEVRLPEQSVRSFARLPDGTVFVGTDNGLYRQSQSGAPLQRLQFRGAKPGLVVMALHLDGNRLWVGTGEGFWWLDLLARPLGPLQRFAAAEGLNRKYITVINRDARGMLWIGTLDAGLFLLDPQNANLRKLNFKNDHQDHVHGYISSLLFDARGQLWIATQGGGVTLVPDPLASQPGQQLRHFGMAEGLPNEMANKMMQDQAGRIWVSTDAGMAVIDPEKNQVRALYRPDGVAISAYFSNAGDTTPDGALVFGGARGLTVIRPERLQTWNFRPPVVITQIQVGGKTQPNRDALTIAPEANSFAVEFSALDYSAPERNRYAYKLEGYDKDWIGSDPTRRLASYTNLPPGQYRLLLRGSNRNGLWSEPERVLPIMVLAAWYQSWWWHATLGLLGLLAFWALVQMRTRYLKQRQQELESQVQQRTFELNQKQSELVAANQGLAASVETLRQLGDVGREITGHLDASRVFNTLYQYVGSLLDVTSITIYRVNRTGDGLELVFGREDGKELQGLQIPLDSPTSNAARVAREKRDLLLDFAPDQIDPSQIPGTRLMLTVLFSPLVVDQHLLGVMSIQSDQRFAYGERELLICRTLCSYGAIALSNAQTLSRLGDAQAQLIHQEKLASLGTLTAGIAHEINNPSNFAHVGAYNLSTELAALQRFLLELAGDDAPPELVAALQIHFDKMKQSLATISEGTSRIRDLVRDLRTFSRLDEAAWKTVAVGDSLQATVNLVRTEFANQVEIRCDLAANPELECWPAQLNQVFMNLIVNACQAIAEREPERQTREPGLLQIRSRLDQDYLVLEFEDNGIGMPEAIQERIFDPFFTTKTVGEGMGMGLSISFGIITKHNGSMTVKSSVGVGTCFTLRLPLAKPINNDQ